MKKLKREEIDLPFVVGETYVSKMQTAEKFTVSKITTKHNKATGKNEIIRLEGIWEKAPHLGDCPLNPDRLIPRKEFTGKEYYVNVCPKCKHEEELD